MLGTNWLGPSGHVLHYPVRRGELMNYISFVERDDWQIESWTVAGTTAELANDYRGWHPDVHAIIRNIDVPFKWALMIRSPMERWTRGRISLLGDACHSTLPFLGRVPSWRSRTHMWSPHACGSTAATRRSPLPATKPSGAIGPPWSCVSHENRKQAFSPALADKDEVAASVARDWQQVRMSERLDWLYACDRRLRRFDRSAVSDAAKICQ